MRTSLSFIPGVSIPADDFVDFYIPWNDARIDANFEAEIERINKEYSKMYDDIIGR